MNDGTRRKGFTQASSSHHNTYSLCRRERDQHQSRGFCDPGRILPANINVDSSFCASCHPLATHSACSYDKSHRRADDAKRTFVRVVSYQARTSDSVSRTRRDKVWVDAEHPRDRQIDTRLACYSYP